MDGILNKIKKAVTPLPTTKNGYTFFAWYEYEEALWLIKDGTFKNLEEFGACMLNLNAKKNKATT